MGPWKPGVALGDSKPQWQWTGPRPVELGCGSEGRAWQRGERRVGKGNLLNFGAPAGVDRSGEQTSVREKCKLNLDHCA